MDPRLYQLHPHEAARVANYFEPGMSVDRLEERDDFGSWTVILREPGTWWMKHYNGAIMEVAVDGDRAQSYALHVGEAAIAIAARLAARARGEPSP